MKYSSFLLPALLAALVLNTANAQEIDPASDANVQPNAAVEGYKLAWSDEFNGTEIDDAKWEYRLDSKHWSTQQAKNMSVSDGVANINLRKEKTGGMDYTGGGIISKKYFRYGYYEARIKCPAGAGWHTSFWMMDNHHENSDTSQVELDPLETNSIDLHTFSTDYHQWRSDIGHMKRYQLVKTPDAPLNEFYVYGMEWTPEAAYFYFNGKLVRTAKDLTQQLPKEEKTAGKKPIVRKVSETDKNDLQIWFTSIATWLGNTEKVDDSVLPSTAQCDYVRFFESDFSSAAMKGVTKKPAPKKSAAPVKKLAKGDSSLEMFLATQKAQQEKKGFKWNANKYKKMFEQMDTNGDGIVSGAEKKAYWTK
ncbi:glycoside hydrolase family 16 protein [Pontiella sulfatireligans]|uniref:Beta-glucanase n=1 Tax=Pontiella sulfatireligans TaxID=2750658 RepID=A0A6C2UGE8_9BACT|nr:glycoside hydrolase family 16 protein [Pontiella sulfatireligans]VGO18491.1 Beta-glucanase [Pontiella sulfatireligans]